MSWDLRTSIARIALIRSIRSSIYGRRHTAYSTSSLADLLVDVWTVFDRNSCLRSLLFVLHAQHDTREAKEDVQRFRVASAIHWKYNIRHLQKWFKNTDIGRPSKFWRTLRVAFPKHRQEFDLRSKYARHQIKDLCGIKEDCYCSSFLMLWTLFSPYQFPVKSETKVRGTAMSLK